MLRRLHKAVAARADDMFAAMVEEYGAPSGFTGFSVQDATDLCEDMAKTVETYACHRTSGRAAVSMEPLGVVAAIVPWNSTLAFIASKVATAIAAGSTIVVKPSEMSAIQTQTLAEAIHAPLASRISRVIPPAAPAGATALSAGTRNRHG
jgi:aldehyde dehydrogenase (NAD+)